MKTIFSLKQIAAQAGVSLATVDRVLHNRPGVRFETVERVKRALGELEAQSRLAGFSGRTFYVDVIMQAPSRFTGAVRQAMERALPLMQPLRIRPRFHLHEEIDNDRLIELIGDCRTRGSQGLILKAPDEPAVCDAVQDLTRSGIPVVTLTSDLPHSGRCAYIGIDDRAAGRTAAYLMLKWLRCHEGCVAVNLSSLAFRGEGEREMGFRQLLRERAPRLRVVEISEGLGIHAGTYERTRARLQREDGIEAVYSTGGANRAILEAFADEGCRLEVFIGHDLDRDNRTLLLEQRIDAILDHDLDQDAHRALLWLMRKQGAVSLDMRDRPSRINVVTPFNM